MKVCRNSCCMDGKSKISLKKLLYNLLMLRSEYSIRSEQVTSSNDAGEWNKAEIPQEVSHEEVISLKDLDLDATLLQFTSDDWVDDIANRNQVRACTLFIYKMLNTSLWERLFNFVSFQSMLAEKIGNCLKLPFLATFKVSTAKKAWWDV